jgi:4-amino-4-deoxy-L-arabinose transferase-like glycosyltransferase
LLYNWDAVQFALALREYDVLKHQPHPPGYILYVVVGRIVNAWVDDPTAAYVTLAVAFSGLTTFVVYYLGCAVYDRTTGLVAAALLAVSPLFWFYGSVGLTYAGEALFASTVAYFAFRALNGSRTDAYLAAWYLGLAGGMRQSLLVLLFPLWCGCLILGVRRLRPVAVALAILGGSVLTWFVPMIWLTGGLERYVAASVELADSIVKPTSIVGGPFETTLRMSRYLLESVLVALGPLAAAGFLAVWYIRRYGWGMRESFLLAWTAPPVAVCTLVHFGQAGYVLTFLPALVIFLSRVLVTALGHAGRALPHPRARVALTASAVALVVLVNGSFFVSARPAPRDYDTPRAGWVRQAHDEVFDWIFSRTAGALREHEDVVRGFVDSIRGLYAGVDTVVITEQGNSRSYPWFRHAMFYLPEYAIYELQVGGLAPGFRASRRSVTMATIPETEIHLPATVERLVWFVDHWSPSTVRPKGLVEIEIPHGRYLYVLPLGKKPVDYEDYTIVRAQPPRRAVSAARARGQ